MTARIAALTIVAMAAFAANTLLCRIALAGGLIDAATFMSVRTASGAAALLLVVLPRWRRRGRGRESSDWRAAWTLFLYMVCFSFAYLSLGAGTGAVIFFGVVQLTMFAAALQVGERFPLPAWLGLALAAGGLVYLVSPGLSGPDPIGALLMAVAGVSWGVYSLLGRAAADPVEATAYNFLYALPLVAGVGLLFVDGAHASASGLLLAAASGALASGLGYVVWYAALQGLSAGRAGVVQLSVPVLAAFGGVVWLTEPITPRLLIAGAATLGGIALALAQRTAAAARTAVQPEHD